MTERTELKTYYLSLLQKMGMALAQIGACMIDNARRQPGKVEKDEINKRVRKALGFTYP